MIKYNNSNINDWYFYTSDIVKVYRNNAICYYKINTSGDTPTYDLCYAVVNDISQYSDREFNDVYDKATERWYKLNNLNQYEEYGVYDSGRNITYYDGKLTIDDGYEYEWNGSSWVNLGEVTGSTATLPNVPFVLNYNAKNYDATTNTIPYTEGALNAINAVITGATANIIDHHEDGYIQLTGSSSTRIRALVGTTNFSRSSSSPNITIVCKAYTPGSSTEGNILSNRKESYNWMYRHKSSILTFHGNSEQGSIAVSNTVPNTCSVRIDSNRLLTYNNWTQNTTSTVSNFNYGSNSNGGALFSGYYSTNSEFWKGVFYWIYMSLNTLTDEQVQQVIDYNEGNSQSEYPKYYDEIAAPLDNLTFNTLAEAQAYAEANCVYDGMHATINGDRYYFDSTDENGWVEQPYTEYEYIQTQSGNYFYDFNTNFYPTTANTIDVKFTLTGNSIDWGRLICWSSCNSDNCDSTQFRFTTVTSGYAIIGRKGNTSGIQYYNIGIGNATTVVMPLSSTTYTYNTGSTTTTASFNVGEFSLPSLTPMHIFNIGTTNDTRYAANARLHYVKVYDGSGNLVKHYVPSDSNGSPCLYEKVNGELILDTWTGSNHGTLTLGPAI